MNHREPYNHFRPRRAASWWNTLEDLQWPQKGIIDKVKRRAEGFAKADIDTALNFGFHIRFDFSNYFGQLHGYLNTVCEELHKYNIKFIDHYSCNTIERPRNTQEHRRMHAAQRHHVLLHHDPIAAEHAGYMGYRFIDLCQVDVRDGSRGYSTSYQAELFCHNNPQFLEMHGLYLERLLREVDLDGAEIDDMADYGWFSTCGCGYCRDRFKRDYGHELPDISDRSFWGDTSGVPITWGNYENPVFRDWVSMRTDAIADHVKMIKGYFKDKPLLTCCSSTGPILLNAVSLDLEKLTPHLDLLMLENCGMGVGSVKWTRMDAEALQQKDIAAHMGNAPALALSYTIYEKGGYLGWSLSRFWGVANWSSTCPGRLEADPQDGLETHEIVGPLNNWEKAYSDLDIHKGHDIPEVRLVSNRFCRDNGWRDAEGREHWDYVLGWSGALVEHNVGYRIVRSEELADAEALLSESTPLVIDGIGCVSAAQFAAVSRLLEAGGKVWLGLPFGTHDEHGFRRAEPLSDALIRNAAAYPGLRLLEAGACQYTSALHGLIASGAFTPRIRQTSGDTGWAARLRAHPDGVVLHLMNRSLEAIAHPELRDAHDDAQILQEIVSCNTDNQLVYELEYEGLSEIAAATSLHIRSPELGKTAREATIEQLSATKVRVTMNLEDIDIYAVVS